MSAATETKVEIPKHARQWTLQSYPKAEPKLTDVKLETVPLDADKLKDGEILVKVLYQSVDPYMRGTMNPIAYGAPNPLGSVLRGGAVGTVIKSKSLKFKEGETVGGPFAWKDYAIIHEVVVESVPKGIKPSYALGAVGMPGATAYYGLYEILKPRPKETIFISAASGAVGSIVAQLARISGCRVVGSAGGVEKVKLCKDLGYDAAIDYRGKTKEQILEELKVVAPAGIDMYYENTGGPVTEAVLEHLNQFGRIAVCGQIAAYNQENSFHYEGVNAVFMMLRKQATMQGFMVTQYKPWTKGLTAIAQYIAEGKIKVIEDETVGLENAFTALLSLFKGENTGKKVIKIA